MRSTRSNKLLSEAGSPCRFFFVFFAINPEQLHCFAVRAVAADWRCCLPAAAAEAQVQRAAVKATMPPELSEGIQRSAYMRN
jgi:hypothetical protein